MSQTQTVLDTVKTAGYSLTIGDIAGRTGFPQASVRRVTQQLIATGKVVYGPDVLAARSNQYVPTFSPAATA